VDQDVEVSSRHQDALVDGKLRKALQESWEEEVFVLGNGKQAIELLGRGGGRRSVLQQRAAVDLWACGPVGLWACGPVDLWTCGPVDLWWVETMEGKGLRLVIGRSDLVHHTHDAARRAGGNHDLLTPQER